MRDADLEWLHANAVQRQTGAACQGNAVGTPFFLFTKHDRAATLKLFADAYQPDNPATGGASGITTSLGNSQRKRDDERRRRERFVSVRDDDRVWRHDPGTEDRHRTARPWRSQRR